MTLKFHKSVKEFQDLISQTGVSGQWTGSEAKQMQFRSQAGTVLNWWPSNGTVTFQGSEEDKNLLEAAISGRPISASKETDRIKKRIFVVHGHDASAREQLELILHRFDLDPYVLMNTSGGGQTIIEALEKQIGNRPAAEFGIVLMTPDDIGYAKRDGEKESKPRARQNVILEMGMLLSSLTRDRVVILVKGFVEQPSDAQGIIYLHFNDHVKEVVPKLADRLQKAGIDITAEQIAKAAS